ncbi:LPS-assembly protein LptD [compost metagenome]
MLLKKYYFCEVFPMHIESVNITRPFRHLLMLLVLLLSPCVIWAQVPDTDVVPATEQSDTTAKVPGMTKEAKEKQLGIKISKDAPEDEVTSVAKDSAIMDMEKNVFFLYGNAQINQKDIELKSGVVEFDQKSNVVSAYPTYDTAGLKTSEQEFLQGSEKFQYDSLKYNFKSKRAIVRNARSTYGDAFMISHQVKRNPDQSIYGYKNTYTTCNLDHPHYGIYAKKIKAIPNKVIASGPANLQIADIPTPLMFPFGIFPINPQQKSGFILPTYTMEQNRGLGLQRIGYYFDINDYIGATIQFDIFSKGSYGVYGSTNYTKRYKYNGSLNVNYSKSIFGEPYDVGKTEQNDFRIDWTHQVDPRSMPGASFNAKVEFGTGGYNRVNGMTSGMVLNNQYNTSIAYSKSWIGKPYALSMALRHNQSTNTGTGSITLPDITFNISQITPFQRKNSVGTPKWYEKISGTYMVAAQNRYDFVDSTFSLNNIKWSDFSSGIKHSFSLGAAYNILRFFNFSVNVPYNEYWNTKQLIRTWNPGTRKDDTAINMGFYATRDFSVTSSINTRIYGVKMFRKGRVAGIRHVITPALNFNYTPGFSNKPFNYFYNYVDQYGYSTALSPYSISPGNVGYPTNPYPVGSAGISINNTLQMKVRGKDTGATRIVSILDGFGLNANYNFFADSNNLSAINLNARTNVAKHLDLTLNGQLDAYRFKNGYRSKEFLINTGGPLVQLRTLGVGLGFNYQGGEKSKKDNETEEGRKGEEAQLLLRNNGINDYYDFNIPWNININSSLNYVRRNLVSGKDTIIITPNLSFTGSIRFTPKMMLNITSGYDFYSKSIGYTTINVTRDLHCWQMMLNIVPFGIYRNYNFTINVKSSVLQDLKLVRRRAYQDNY